MLLSSIRNFGRKNLLLRKFIGYYLASSGLFDSFFRKYKVSPEWEKRISYVLSSADNDFIPRFTDAGKIENGKQLMHNGLRIYLGSYYGPEYSRMLLLSRGVHEPQEERVFMEVLKDIGENGVMIEMGAFWSFYSMWFKKEVRGAVNYMIEPDAFNLGQGKRNFRLNNMDGKFIQAFVGKTSSRNKNGSTICVDDLVKAEQISFIDILHSDIQGFEYEMLLGAEKTFENKMIGYIFISTHSNVLHYKCLDFLIHKGFFIIASADIDESFSEDGLIVARAPYFHGIGQIAISKRLS
jgi:methyltransferase FkbM-like protein